MIYALVVAIDKYPIRHHELNGCVNDAEAFIAYLEGNYACEELDIKRLFDQEATRANVIAGFQHFQQANSDDTCVLYYCGHGAQATAPAEFRHIDPDGLLETLVCWDSRIEGGRDLFDKELSYLIWEATQANNPHFAAIFDCCHSGTNTRDTRVKARMADPMKEIPRARDFHGLANYQRSAEGAGRTEQFIPPTGRHIALAAARAEQTAKELRIGHQTHGAFTYNLIAILEQFHGNISYGQLIAHLQGRVPNYVNEQNPQLGTVAAEDKDLLFLGKAADTVPQEFTVHYDKKAGEWRINAGEIHNLHHDQASQISISVKIGLEEYELGVSKVSIGYAVLTNIPEAFDENSSYPATLKSFPARLLKVGLEPDMEEELAEQILQTEKDVKASYFKIVPHSEQPEFWIKTIDGDLILTRPGDEHPVFRRLPADDYDMRRLFLTDVDSVGQYYHVLDTHNPRTTIREEEYEIELYRITDNNTWEADDMAPAEQVNVQQEVVFNYDYNADKAAGKRWVQPAFRCKVRNTGRRPLFFSALSLQADFMITNKFLPSQKLKPGEEAWLLDSIESGQTFRSIPLKVADAFRAHGVTEITEHFKFIISTLELSTDKLNQKALEMDNPRQAQIDRVGRDAANYPPKHSWTAVDITYKVVRPLQEAQVEAGESRSLGSILDIEMPAGVSALATLNGQKAATRSLLEDQLTLPEYPVGWTRHALHTGVGQHETIDTLELAHTAGADQVTADNPIRVKLHQSLEDGEVVLPLGFDPDSGMYYPLGIMDEAGSIRIEELPEPNTTSTRSLGGSIKIFFTKAIGKYLPFVYTHPQLAISTLEVADDTEEVAAAGLKVVYKTDTAEVKDAVAEAQRIALYIHGIIGDTTEMPKTMELVEDATGKKLKEQYDLVLTFDYENLNTPIQDTAASLRDKLASVGLGPEHGKTFHIIAHSMGGLVSRWFIEQLEGNKVVNKLIMLGTPNQGSPYGSLYEMVTPLLATAVNGAAFLKPYILPIKYVGKFVDKMFFTLEQMKPDSDFYKGLNVGTDPQIPYVIIAGNTQLIPFELQDKQAKLLRKIMERFKTRGHYDALDLMLFKAPNDMAVKTEFIKDIPDSANWTTPPQVMECACDHISYFGDPAGLARIQEVLLS